MFETKFRDLAIFRQFVNTVQETVDLLNFSNDGDGISMRAFTSSRNIFISMFIPKSEFEIYRCDRKTEWTIESKLLASTLRMSELDSETCLLKYTDHCPDVIEFKFKNEQTGMIRSVFNNLMEPEDIGVMSQNDFDFRCKMNPKDFQREMANMHLCKTVKIQTSMTGVHFLGRGDSQRIDVEFPLSPDQNANMSLEIRDASYRESNTLFSRKWISKASKICGTSETVELKFFDGRLCIEHPIGENDGYFRFFVAPIIDDEQMDR